MYVGGDVAFAGAGGVIGEGVVAGEGRDGRSGVTEWSMRVLQIKGIFRYVFFQAWTIRVDLLLGLRLSSIGF